jgi:hypothetical protein
MIVLSLFFHFLLAFHRQFVLLFLNEQFFNRTTRTGQDTNLLWSQLSRDKAKTGLESSARDRSSQLEATLGNVMQTEMGPLRKSGTGKLHLLPGCTD